MIIDLLSTAILEGADEVLGVVDSVCETAFAVGVQVAIPVVGEGDEALPGSL